MAEPYDLIVVGMGAAGLAAVLSALETVEKAASRDVSIAVVERAPRTSRGGNTRWSTATFRMKDPDTLNDDFIEAFGPRTVDAGEYVSTLAASASETIHWAESRGLEFTPGPRVFMTSSDCRIQPVGAGAAIVDVLGRHVDDAARGRFFGPAGSLGVAVEIFYETTAQQLEQDADGAVTGLLVRSEDGDTKTLPARAVILASGGFEGNPEMMKQHLGFDVPPISEGGRFNQGEGIAMALAIGAKETGQWNQYHPLPADPRTAGAGGLLTFRAVMETIPYSIMVNRNGRRFMDEGADSMDYLYDIVGRAVQQQPEQIGYAIFDEKVMEVPGYQEAVSDKVFDPYTAETVHDLAAQIQVPSGHLAETIELFNAAVPADTTGFTPTEKDSLATVPGLEPSKSNWARPIDRPPFYAYPVTCAGVFTFGGIGTNGAAEVVDTQDEPIPGLYAAGEMTGLYHNDYVGATSVLRALVFGRIAGRRAITYALES